MSSAPIPPIPLSRHDADFDGFSRDLGASFERFGFAVIEGHGLDRERLDAALADAKAFFALPEAAKRGYVIPGGAGQRGYTPFRVETAKGAEQPDLKEFWHIGRDLPDGHPYRGVIAPNVWPAQIASFQTTLGGLYADLDTLGLKVLRGVARHLGLAPDAFAPAVKDGDSVLRLLRYPPLETAPELGAVRAGAHEDINAITLLLGAEEAGLELLDRDGRWLAINPPPGSLVVNIGDMLQRLTNHVLPSTTHRVVNPTAERAGVARYSMPFFLHFAPDFEIRTLPGCITAARPDRYPEPITAGAYLQQRLREIGLAA
jgi:isopenicillin N synthase-like dioxygenase